MNITYYKITEGYFKGSYFAKQNYKVIAYRSDRGTWLITNNSNWATFPYKAVSSREANRTVKQFGGQSLVQRIKLT